MIHISDFFGFLKQAEYAAAEEKLQEMATVRHSDMELKEEKKAMVSQY